MYYDDDIEFKTGIECGMNVFYTHCFLEINYGNQMPIFVKTSVAFEFSQAQLHFCIFNI